jgi:hypothetical protein
MVTKEMAIQAIDNRIAEETTPDAAQRRYTATMETMMAFDDQGLRNGEWRIILTHPDKPFVIGDAPVVTWERTDQYAIVHGQGFAQPKFGIVRLGIDGFSINHLDHAAKLFEILMNQPVYGGPINEGENLPGIDIPL